MAGDYVTTGDNVIPPDVQGEAWEVPATLNHTWGYRTDDHDWKSPQTVIFKLIDIVSRRAATTCSTSARWPTA